MQRFKLLNLALACALLFNLPVAARAQQTRTEGTTAGSAATAAATATATLPAAALETANTIKAARLSEYLHFVASDAMGGRDTPSKGLDDTAKFLADHLARLKIRPAGDDGTYFQKIELVSFKVDPLKSSVRVGDRAYKFGEDFLAGTADGNASGALVYAGHGFVVKSKNINAYTGLDVRDKIVIVAGVLPQGVARGDLKGRAGEGEWEDAESYARKNGAKGLIRIPRNFERQWRISRFAAERERYQVARFMPGGGAGGAGRDLPSILPSAALLDALFAGERRTGEDLLKGIAAGNAGESFSLAPSKRAEFTVSVASKKAMTQNVVGVLEGSDPTLKNEYVAIGAHYDHVGTGQPVDGDAIYNGADDDGSGTVGVLAIAEALAAGARPKRSVLFIWHCAEEKGLWGSEYFTKFPTVPLSQIVAQLNMDMIGRSKKEGDTNPANRDLSGANEIYVIGSKMMSTDLGELSERVNRAYLNLNFNYKYDDPADTNRFFFRSDHFNYAQRGIPIIFYFDGVHEDYHRPSDTADKIDYQKMEKISRTVFLTALELANAPTRPRVDRQLPAQLMER
ncbi:MAG TPA: M20/M25/M40 family metallo-hydrolase [Pyrinomonadaceae bacterium]|nr:M20/M25/M40 family metallo-hydrolase [Pyrinomonadaceae bacterium]